MVLELNSSSRVDGKDLGGTWYLGECRWYWLWRQAPTPTRGRWWFQPWGGLLLQAPPMPLDNLILQPNDGSLPDDRGYAVSPWGYGPLVGGTVMISHFSFMFITIMLFHSVLLHSVPLLTPTAPIFPNRHHTLHPSAPPCLERWLHTIHDMYPTHMTHTDVLETPSTGLYPGLPHCL